MPEPVRHSPVSPATAACSLEGALVISTVAEWHRRLLAAVSAHAVLVIDLRGLTHVDVFGLQLLFSASRMLVARGGRLELTGAPAAFHEACASAGLPASLFLAP